MSLNLNPESIEVEEVSNLVPAGKHVAVVHSIREESRVAGENAKTPGAKYEQLSIRFEIIEGESAGRSVFHNCIYDHEASPVAAEIGRQFLKRLYVAGKCTGNLTVESLESAAPVLMTVGVQKSEQYGNKNVIKFVAPSNSAPVKEEPTGTAQW